MTSNKKKSKWFIKYFLEHKEKNNEYLQLLTQGPYFQDVIERL